jgi:hypothetical protein
VRTPLDVTEADTCLQSPELLQLVQVHQTPFTGRHILLSYDADSELDGYLDSVNQIRNHLASMGHTIWAKKDCAEPELAENIACATLVIIFISRAYKESPTCRLQGQFADEAQKRILPMVACRAQQPTYPTRYCRAMPR